MDDYYVYAWLRPCGDPFYIGKGRKDRDTSLYGRNPIFHRILTNIREDGEQPTIVRVKEGLSESDAFDLERKLIAEYGRKNNGTGILSNITDGGEGISGHKFSEESRRKLSESRRNLKLPPASEQRKQRISAANKGRVHTREQRNNNKIAQHSRPILRRNTSGYVGVCFHSDRNKWGASIRVDGKTTNLGRYDTPEEAARVRDEAAIRLVGPNVTLNFPEQAAA